MANVERTSFVVRGTPRGKGRPRMNTTTGRTYTPQPTKAAEARVHEAWEAAGQPDLGDGPVSLHLIVVVERPGSHWRVHGGLTKLGERKRRPTSKPDLDNVLKLVADALNKRAYTDDARITRAVVERRWAQAGEREHMHVELACIGSRIAPAQDRVA